MNRFIYLFKTNKNSLMHYLNKIIEFGRGAPNDAHATAAQSGKIVQKRDCGPTMADTALAHESKKTRRGRFSGVRRRSAGAPAPRGGATGAQRAAKTQMVVSRLAVADIVWEDSNSVMESRIVLERSYSTMCALAPSVRPQRRQDRNWARPRKG